MISKAAVTTYSYDTQAIVIGDRVNSDLSPAVIPRVRAMVAS
jgi:hypothetical protein